MTTRMKKAAFASGLLLIVLCMIIGCGESMQKSRGIGRLVPKTDPGITIGSIANVVSIDKVKVEGYALVGGLRATGSTQCPPLIRDYLEKYIKRQLPEQEDVGSYIDSPNTAAVRVWGLMPAVKNARFDLMVTAIPGSQTTSLEGGQLWGAELWEEGKFAVASRVLATAEGPVFIDKITNPQADEKTAFILAGAKVLDDYKVMVVLHKQDYATTSKIRSILNERFGKNVASASRPGEIMVKVPVEYRKQRKKFISLVKAVYLDKSPQITEQRISRLARNLAVSEEKSESEIALEAIGKESLSKLAALLNSSEQQVRLRAARCMLNLGSDRGLDILRKIAMDKNSIYRVEALDAIAKFTQSSETAGVLRKLLRDEDFNISLKAYENLRELNDISVSSQLIAGNFYLEQITGSKEQSIYVYRTGQPRIVLFGAPIYCRNSIFIQSADGNVTLNAPAGQNFISIIRRHPTRPRLRPIQLKSSFELGDVIRTLCQKPLDHRHLGLNISYSNAIELLKQMCEKGALEAEFRVSALPEINQIVKK